MDPSWIRLHRRVDYGKVIPYLLFSSSLWLMVFRRF
jgi:hypothetical protein